MVGVIRVVCKHVLFHLLSTFDAPPCQACSVVGFVGMVVQKMFRLHTLCPATLYAAIFAHVHPT